MKIERKSLLDATVDTLRTAIIRGKLEPGSRLTEISLAEETDSRRSTVRSALLELEKEGLVHRARYSSWSVAPISSRTIREVYSFRGALEGLAARLVASSLTPAKKEALAQAYRNLTQAEKSGNEDARVEADLQFHRSIVAASGHDLLLEQYDLLMHRIEWVYRWSERRSPRRIDLEHWHSPVLQGVLSGDADRSEKAIRALTEASLADDLADLDASSRQKA